MNRPVRINTEICWNTKCKHYTKNVNRGQWDSPSRAKYSGSCMIRRCTENNLNHKGCPVPKDCPFYNVHLSNEGEERKPWRQTPLIKCSNCKRHKYGFVNVGKFRSVKKDYGIRKIWAFKTKDDKLFKTEQDALDYLGVKK